MTVQYHPAVEAELREIQRYYEERAPGLGTDFLDEFERQVLAIAATPEKWMVATGDIRRCLMRRFPYVIFFRQIGADKNTTVEGRNWLGEGKRINQHLHAKRRPAAGNAERNARIPQPLDGFDGAGRQRLVLRDQRSIHIGDHQANVVSQKDLISSPRRRVPYCSS